MIRKDQAEDMARGFGLNYRHSHRYSMEDGLPLRVQEDEAQMQLERLGKYIAHKVPPDMHKHRDMKRDHTTASLYAFNREQLTAFVEQVAAKVEEQVVRRLLKGAEL